LPKLINDVTDDHGGKCSMAIDIDKIKVEPVYDYFDRAEVSSVLSRCHPLGEKKAMGHRISYAASYRGEWVAVLMFDKAVDRNKHREARIGWSSEQVASRRKHIANNSRFLVLPKYQGIPNLASKILSMVSARISEDWRKRYGIVLLALETYVDPEHNENDGSCYKASGWENLGYSTGYLNPNGERTHSKWYFLKPLHKDSYAALSSELPHALLTGVKEVSGKSNNNYVLDASKIKLKELQKDLEQITDPRSEMGRRYEFVPLLSLCISAVLSGYTQYRQIADWIAKLSAEDRVKFGLPGDRVPHETTIGNFLASIDPIELNRVLTNWLLKTYNKNDKIKTISLDGKALRATSSEASEQKAFLNVFAHELGIVINHVPTEKGGGEKIAAQDVLKNDNLLNGKVVLADAIHTDRNFIQALEKKTPRMSSLLKTIKNL
jgi:hypothetical protein